MKSFYPFLLFFLLFLACQPESPVIPLEVDILPVPQKLIAKNGTLSLKNSFLTTKPLKGESVVIVDDVMTTGATAQALALELKKAGAGDISVWVLARTPNHNYK